MTITIGGTAFDDHEYDARGDVLYLSVGTPRPAARTLETSEGHAVHYGERGTVIGLTLVNIRQTLEREGMVAVSWPPEHVGAATLRPAVPVGGPESSAEAIRALRDEMG